MADLDRATFIVTPTRNTPNTTSKLPKTSSFSQGFSTSHARLTTCWQDHTGVVSSKDQESSRKNAVLMYRRMCHAHRVETWTTTKMTQKNIDMISQWLPSPIEQLVGWGFQDVWLESSHLPAVRTWPQRQLSTQRPGGSVSPGGTSERWRSPWIFPNSLHIYILAKAIYNISIEGQGKTFWDVYCVFVSLLRFGLEKMPI